MRCGWLRRLVVPPARAFVDRPEQRPDGVAGGMQFVSVGEVVDNCLERCRAAGWQRQSSSPAPCDHVDEEQLPDLMAGDPPERTRSPGLFHAQNNPQRSGVEPNAGVQPMSEHVAVQAAGIAAKSSGRPIAVSAGHVAARRNEAQRRRSGRGWWVENEVAHDNHAARGV